MLLAGAVACPQQTTPDSPDRFGAFLAQAANAEWSFGVYLESGHRFLEDEGAYRLPGGAVRWSFEVKGLLPDRLELAGKSWTLWSGPRGAERARSTRDLVQRIRPFESISRGIPALVTRHSHGSLDLWLLDKNWQVEEPELKDPGSAPRDEPVSLGQFGLGPFQFGDIEGLAFASTGHLYVLDRLRHRVVCLELEVRAGVPDGREFNGGQPEEQRWRGRLIHEFGSRGQGPGQFSYPTDLDIHDDRVYVTDRGNHRIQVFGLEGHYLYEWGIHSVEPGDGAGKLHYPESLAISEDGKVAVVHEPLLGRLQAFGLTDEPAEQFMTDPVTLTGLGGHMGPRFSVHGSKVAIFDPEAQKVQLYDTEIASVPIKVTEFGGAGTGAGQFMDLVDLTFDQRGDLWVLDRGTRSVAQLRADYGDELMGFDARLMSLVRRFDLEALAAGRESWCNWPDRLDWLDGGLWIGQGSSRWRLERPAGERRWVLGPDSPQGPRAVQPELDRADWEWNQGSAELGRHDLRKPTAAQWVGDDLWVLDFGHHRLLRYDSSGAVTAAIGPPSYTRPARRSAPAPHPVPEEE